MKSKTRFLTALLMLLILTTSIPFAFAEGEAISGQCGNNVYWSYNETTATLTIDGTGDMWDYDTNNESPFRAFYREMMIANVHNGVTGLGSYSFYNCSSLKSVSLPNSLLKIGARAFACCDDLESIVIPDSVTELGEGVFFGGGWSTNLKSVVLGNGLTSVPKNTFLRCFSLESVSLGQNIQRIEKYAFMQCQRLSEINIPDSVSYIGEEAFYQCYNLTQIHLSENVKTIEGSAFVMSGLTSLTIPSSVTRIQDGAFMNCEDLEQLVISSGVKEIGFGAFGMMTGRPDEYDTLKEITVPESVDVIESLAFSRAHLEKLTVLNPNCSFLEDESMDQCTIVRESTTLYGYENSTTQQYAEKYGLTFVSIGEEPQTMDMDLFQRIIEWIRSVIARIIEILHISF